MHPRRLRPYLAPLAILAFSGCGYVHVGRLPPPITTIVGDDKLLHENSELRTEKKILQQELALTRAQGDALRSAIENRTADGDTSRRLVDKLAETTRELAGLRANYSKLQNERATLASTTPAELAALKSQLAGTEEKLASSLRNFTQLQEEVTGLRRQVDDTRTENLALTQHVKTVTTQNEQVQAALAQLNTELLAQKESRARAEQDATTLRTQLAGAGSTALAQQRTAPAAEAKSLAAPETGELRTQLDALRTQVSSLQQERTALQRQLAVAELAAKTPGLSDTKALADTQAQLIAALGGAKMLRDENDQLKNRKTALEDELAQARTAAPVTQTLRDQLAQTQAQAAALSAENAQLKTRLATGITPRPAVATATTGSAPASPVATSTPRPAGSPVTATFVINSPGTPLPANSATPPPAALAAAADPTPATRPPVAGGPRYHTVTGGDTLSKISAQYYGTPGRWAEILVANRDVLGESNNLVIGRQLRIP